MTPEHAAYVIFTSGSTGEPKGATNTHGGLHNRLAWMQDAYRLTPADAVLQKTPFSFDVSVWEFFWPLITGARLVIAAPGAHRDPGKLVDTIRKQNVTTLHFVPSMLQAFLGYGEAHTCDSIRHLICSGEALSPRDPASGVRSAAEGAARKSVRPDRSRDRRHPVVVRGRRERRRADRQPDLEYARLCSGRPVAACSGWVCVASCTLRVRGWRGAIWGVPG